jgi:hypothetical protein
MMLSKKLICLVAGILVSAVFSLPTFTQNCNAPRSLGIP